MDSIPIKPVADATKAVAETTGKALDIVSAVGKFSNRLIGDAFAEGGGMLRDQVHYWRKMRLVDLETKFNSKCEARGLDPDTLKPLSLGQTVQILEAASIEESDEVQELWAELLANAVDPKSGVTIKKMYVTLLRDIGPAEAALLEVLGRFREFEIILTMPLPIGEAHKRQKELEDELNAIADRRWRKFSDAERQAAVSNLRRLGCVAPHITNLPYLNGLITQVRIGQGSRDYATQIDPRQFERLLEWVVEAIHSAGGGGGPQSERTARNPYSVRSVGMANTVNVPEVTLELTPIGAELVAACSSVGSSRT